MVSDRQVKRLWRLAQKLPVEAAAAKSGMDSKTARKYLEIEDCRARCDKAYERGRIRHYRRHNPKTIQMRPV